MPQCLLWYTAVLVKGASALGTSPRCWCYSPEIHETPPKSPREKPAWDAAAPSLLRFQGNTFTGLNKHWNKWRGKRACLDFAWLEQEGNYRRSCLLGGGRRQQPQHSIPGSPGGRRSSLMTSAVGFSPVHWHICFLKGHLSTCVRQLKAILSRHQPCPGKPGQHWHLQRWEEKQLRWVNTTAKGQ